MASGPFKTSARRAMAPAIVVLSWAAACAAAAPDPVEGLWLGEAGSAKEKIEVGLDVRRNAQGALEIRLTQPVSNYFGQKVEGEVVRDGDAIRVDALALALKLEGGRLVGTYPGPNSPAVFARARDLPLAPRLPDVPAGPPPRWQARIGAQAFASPVVADGIAYIGTSGGVFNAVRVADGGFAWAFPAGGAIFGDARVEDDAVYFVADLGLLFKLDRRTGRELWRYTLTSAPVARVLPHPQVFDWDWQAPTPLLADGVVYVGAGDGGFHAVDAATGQRRWRFEAGAKIRTGAAVDGDLVLFGSADHFVYALRRDRGQEAWRFDTGAVVDSTPVVSDGKVLVGNRGGGLYSIDAASGQLAWRLYFWGSWVEATPVVVDGVIYIGSSDLRRVSAIDPRDGRVLWRSDVFGWSWGTPAVTSRHLYVGTAGGEPYFIRHVAALSQLDRRSGRILRRWPMPDAGGHQWGIAGSPAIWGDTLVVASIEGSLFGFPIDDGLPVPAPPPGPGERVADGVTLIRGTYEAGRQPDGNSVVFAAPEGLVVLDTGRHVEHTRRILDLARALGQPIVDVLNSHWHLDHVSGNPRLRREYPALRVHASPAIEGAMAGFLRRSRLDGLRFLEQAGDPVAQAEVRGDIASIESGPALYPDERITAAGTRTFAGLRLDVGYATHAVTAADLWFFEPRTRVLAAGDLVTLPAPFFDTACPARWQRTLADLDAVDFAVLVPGHGPPMKHAEFSRYRQAFDHLLACAAGGDPATACVEGWQRDAAGWLATDADRRQAAGLLGYYFASHLRGQQAKLAALCDTASG